MLWIYFLCTNPYACLDIMILWVYAIFKWSNKVMRRCVFMTTIWQLSNWAYRLVFSDKIFSFASSFLILLSVCVSKILWIMINSFQLVSTSFVSFRQHDGDHQSGMVSITVRQPMAVVLRWRFVDVDMVSHTHQPIGSGEPLRVNRHSINTSGDHWPATSIVPRPVHGGTMAPTAKIKRPLFGQI